MGTDTLTDDRTRFPAELYPLWCRVWLYVQDYATHLADWLGKQLHSPAPAVTSCDPPAAALRADLEALISCLDRPKPETADLARALGCLHSLERTHPKDARSFLVRAPEIDLHGSRYALVPPLRLTTRSGDSRAKFPLSDELAVKGTLGLGYRWLRLPADTSLDWQAIADLDILIGMSSLRIGLAPFASGGDMDMTVAPQDARAPDGRVPIQCRCAREREPLRRRLEAVLHAAWERRVHVLVLPELVVDEDLLGCCRDWLGKNNARERRLRLVVAGSRHCPAEADFANRCTVLGPLGDIRWEQDKRSPYTLDKPELLDRLSPTVKIALAFEPTALGAGLVVAQTALGRALTPICLDFIEGALWSELGADLYLVPAMTDGLGRFRDQARRLGGLHGAASFVCNAQTTGKERCHHYLPVRGRSPVIVEIPDIPLFTVDVTLAV